MKKQLVSILFALCMVLCLVPLAAFAEGETENVQVVADQTTLVAAIDVYKRQGWFSAVYLNLRTLSERGVLPSRNSDIYATFTAAMIDPLPEKQREFLAVMGLADEFTVEMAQCITGDADAAQILAMLTEQNAFVTRLPDGVTYRFHHMMKECAERSFHEMKAETQKLYWERFGLWYENQRQYLHAIAAYRKSEDYHAPVSYTHLDVYKRQACACATWMPPPAI